MKRGAILFSLLAILAVSARCQTAMIALDDIPGTTLVCVTNYGPVIAAVTGRVAAVEGYTNNVTALSSAVTATNALFAAWFAGLFSETNKWMAAYGWGNWAGPVASNTAAILVLQTNAVPVTATNGWTVTPHLPWITNETDAAALGALTTNRVTRWYDPEDVHRWAEWDGMTNIIIYREVVRTNITMSGGFVPGANGVYTNAASESGFRYIGPAPYVIKDDIGVIALYDTQTQSVSARSDNTVPPYGPWNNGVEIIDLTTVFSTFNYTTNVEWRYVLPTNAIPPELANLDNLQGWLNELYAKKSIVDGHITGGTHTNLSLVGGVTLGGSTITEWPTGGDGGATNFTVGAASVPYNAATRSFDATGVVFPVTSGTATNPTFAGTVTLTNATSFAAGSYFGTNGVFFTRDGTNNWILF